MIYRWNSLHHFSESCQDGVKNGDELGIDCGGSCPNVCKDKSMNNSPYFFNLTAKLPDDFESNFFYYHRSYNGL